MSTAEITSPDIGQFHAGLSLDSIAPSKTNPRKHFEQTDLEELSRSIKEKGVIQPIVVRPHPKKSAKLLWEIVAGERRYRASKLAGREVIPAIARDLDDIAVLEIQVIENGQREDVHELEEAHGYKALIDTAGYDAKTIAEKVSKSPEYVYARLKLLNLIAPLQGKFLDGTITAGHAILFARLPADSQVAAGKRLYERDFGSDKREPVVVSVRELARWIQDEIQMDLSKTLFDKEDAKLVPAAGACSACPKRTGAEPQLWPELGKKDQCTDNSCFQRKVNAHIKREVDVGNMVRLTDDYSNRKKAGFYPSSDFREVKKNSCSSTALGVFVDGYHRGTTRTICISLECKLHHGRGGSGFERRIISPSEQFNNAKASINQTIEAEHRRKLYETVLPKLEAAAIDLPKIARKPILFLILQLVYDRLDSQATRSLTEELKLKKTQYAQSASSDAVVAYAKNMNPSQLLAFTARVALNNLRLGFTSGAWESDKKKASVRLAELVEEFGVKTDPIATEIETLRKQKLAKAKERMEKAQAARKSKKKGKAVQTSAKRKAAPAADEDPDDDDSAEDEGSNEDDDL